MASEPKPWIPDTLISSAAEAIVRHGILNKTRLNTLKAKNTQTEVELRLGRFLAKDEFRARPNGYTFASECLFNRETRMLDADAMQLLTSGSVSLAKRPANTLYRNFDTSIAEPDFQRIRLALLTAVQQRDDVAVTEESFMQEIYMVPLPDGANAEKVSYRVRRDLATGSVVDSGCKVLLEVSDVMLPSPYVYDYRLTISKEFPPPQAIKGLYTTVAPESSRRYRTHIQTPLFSIDLTRIISVRDTGAHDDDDAEDTIYQVEMELSTAALDECTSRSKFTGIVNEALANFRAIAQCGSKLITLYPRPK